MLPVRGAQIVKKTDGVARAGSNANCGGVVGSLFSLSRHTKQGGLRFALFVEIHFELQRKQIGGRGIGVKLVVNGKEDASRVHGVRDGAKMPRRMAEEIALLDDRGFDVGGVYRILREQD